MTDETLEEMLIREESGKGKPDLDTLREICQYLSETDNIENRSPLFIKRLAKISTIGYRHLLEENRRKPQDTTDLLDELDSYLEKLYDFCIVGIKKQQAKNKTHTEAINLEAHLHNRAGEIANLIFRRSGNKYWGEEAYSKMQVASNMHKKGWKRGKRGNGYKMHVVSNIGNVARNMYKFTGDIYGWGREWIEYKKEAVRLANNDIIRLEETGGLGKIPERMDFLAYRQAQIGEAVYTLVTDAISSGFGPGLSIREIEEGVESYKSALTYLISIQERTPESRGLHFFERRMIGAEGKIAFLEEYLPKKNQQTPNQPST